MPGVSPPAAMRQAAALAAQGRCAAFGAAWRGKACRRAWRSAGYAEATVPEVFTGRRWSSPLRPCPGCGELGLAPAAARPGRKIQGGAYARLATNFSGPAPGLRRRRTGRQGCCSRQDKRFRRLDWYLTGGIFNLSSGSVNPLLIQSFGPEMPLIGNHRVRFDLPRGPPWPWRCGSAFAELRWGEGGPGVVPFGLAGRRSS